MTNLVSLEKIKKLPELKKGFRYSVDEFGKVDIVDNCFDYNETLYVNFGSFINNKYWKEPEEYEKYLSKPLIEDVEVEEMALQKVTKRKIVGYE